MKLSSATQPRSPSGRLSAIRRAGRSRYGRRQSHGVVPTGLRSDLAVEVDGQPLVDGDLWRALPIAVPVRSDTVEDRLRPGETVPAQLTIPAEDETRAVPVSVHIGA